MSVLAWLNAFGYSGIPGQEGCASTAVKISAAFSIFNNYKVLCFPQLLKVNQEFPFSFLNLFDL